MVRLGRSYPAQRIWTPYVKPVGPTGPVYDAIGAGGVATAGTVSWSHTATAGAAVLVFVACNATSTSSVTYGGTSMTSAGSVFEDNISGDGQLSVWKLTNVTGGAQTVAVTLGTAAHVVGNSLSATGVTTVGSPSTNFGTSTPSQSVTWAAAQLIVQAFGADASMGSPTGGTNRYNSSGAASLTISTATANTTFGAANTFNQWAGAAVILS